MSISKNLVTIAENPQKVYDAGKQAEYDAFWDTYQDNGERRHYDFAFGGYGWTDETFIPKYDIIVVSGDRMFCKSKITSLKNIGVTIDFSMATSVTYPLQSDTISDIGVLDFQKLSHAQYILGNAKALINVDKLILAMSGSQTFGPNSFVNCKLLEHIIFEGCIGQNGFNMQWSTKLDKESLTSIINCLSAATTDLSITISKTAVDNAFETAEGAADGSSGAEWAELIADRSNWTINLV